MNILQLFPYEMKRQLERWLNNRWDELEEIRLRVNQPIELIFTNSSESVSNNAFTKEDSTYVINQLSEHSLYRLGEELREGFITIQGGHRVGLAGKSIIENGKVTRIQYITFLNIRISKEKVGIANEIAKSLCNHDSVYHTLIIGAPQSGKTTMLRDLARIFSNGDIFIPPKKVAIIDERSEIAASHYGIPQHDVGNRTDVMDACPKSVGMMMMIRSMSPQIILVDEIGKVEDVEALKDVMFAGVTIVCTVHGQSIDDVRNRLLLKELFKMDVFKRLVFLEKEKQDFTFKIEGTNGEVIAASVVN